MNWFSKKIAVLSGAVILSAIFTTSLSAKPSVTMEPKVVKVGDKITVTIESDGWILKGGPTVKGPAEGSLTSSGGTLTATEPGYVIVTTYWEPPKGNAGEEEMNASATATVVFVNLEPISAGNNPDISPNMCTNAQPEYKKAKWKATVLPEGTIAWLKMENLHIENDERDYLSNGDVIIVMPDSIGEYKIRLIHSELSSCFVEKSAITFAFKLERKRIGCWSPINENPYRFQECETYGNEAFTLISRIYSPSEGRSQLSLIGNAATSYLITTEPANAYEGGLVKAPTIIKARERTSIEAKGAWIYIPFIGYIELTRADAGWNANMEVSGLHFGNGEGPGWGYSISAIKETILSPTWENAFFNLEAATYKIDQEVLVNYRSRLSGSKTGINSSTMAYYLVQNKSIGFVLEPGNYEITK